MNKADLKDWILPAVVILLLIAGFGVLRLVDFGPPDDWSAEDGPFPFKRLEGELERMRAAREAEAAPPAREWVLQGGHELAWSRDGSLLAGARSGETPGIARLAGDEAEVFAIPGLAAPEGGYAWHPQGMLLACGRVGEAAESRLHTTAWTRHGAVPPVDTLDSEDLPGELRHPALSPGGDEVALVAAAGEVERLVVWDRASGEVSPVAEGEALAHPTWSPDGAELAFAERSASQWDVVAVRPAGGERRVVAGGPGDQHLPAWAADGTLLWVDGRALRSHAGLVADRISPVRPAVAGAWVAVVSSGGARLVRVDGTEGVSLEGPVPLAIALAEHGGGLRVAWTDLSQTLTIRDHPLRP